MMRSTDSVKIYFVTIPAHKFLHVKNYESNGYWDFWQKQEKIAGQDCNTICGLLDSIKGKLDDMGGSEANSGAGQIMGYINDPAGQPFCYGIPRAECYGVRLPADYKGEVPSQMLLMDVPEAEYVVFEHGPLTMSRRTAVWREKWRRRKRALTWKRRAIAWMIRPEGSAIFTMIRTGSGRKSGDRKSVV